MLVDKKIKSKLDRVVEHYHSLMYEAVADVPMQIAETQEHLRSVPSDELIWREAAPGTTWGKMWGSAWLKGTAVLPESCDGREVFVSAKVGGAERLLFVDGIAVGLLDPYAAGDGVPVHVAKRACASGKAGQKIELAVEVYSGHPCPGCSPEEGGIEEVSQEARYRQTFDRVQLLLRRDDVKDFYLDLRVLLNLIEVMDPNRLRYNKVMVGLAKVYEIVPQIPKEVSESQWRPALAEARKIMRPLLDAHNGDTMPFIGLTGHSHLDTAWLWTLDESIRKAARTFSTALNMMEQYPEYRFLQSAPCHADMVRIHYPEIFERIREAVIAGSWEPNGGMWVEPDCNIPSGESMIRQFLFGQAFTQKWFGYRSNVYWQPDVFGYSGAIPQIMRGCDVKYFMTTKLSWNDTNRFPYDTFHWQGIDGTKVIAHFNNIHCWPDPRSLADQWWTVQHKDVQDRRYVPYGHGDGGGGPAEEMIEMSRRVVDLEGVPRSRHMGVGEYMQDLERDLAANLPVWQGELYLERHRGTLTSIAGLKRGNRKSELALRDAEWASSLARIHGKEYPVEELETLWKTLLTNQFHDVLPGSSIAEVNIRSVREMQECVNDASSMSLNAIKSLGTEAAGQLTLANSLGWERKGEITLRDVPAGQVPAGEDVVAQRVADIQGQPQLAVTGLSVPSLGLVSVPLAKEENAAKSAFTVDGPIVQTPFASVRFDERGRIASFLDKTADRELVREGGALNIFWCGEDIPNDSDNWDIDFDHRSKLKDRATLLSREIAADGPLQLRIRSRFSVGDKTTITQDIVFHSTTPRVDFETEVDWNETHKVLKAGFDTTIPVENARHEIQFGHLLRPAHRNLTTDWARFEVCNHKWTDVSDARYGVAVLNDCKYGISVLGGEIQLTLLRSGTHPDYRGDHGVHLMDYALLPHTGSFTAESVVLPAYEFNVPLISASGLAVPEMSLASVSAPNIIIDTVKWAEDGNGLVLRLYESENARTSCRLNFGVKIHSASLANMLEEEQSEIPTDNNGFDLEFRPFEVKTVRIVVDTL